MTIISIIDSAWRQAAWSRALSRLVGGLRQPDSPPNIIATWEERRRLRWQLEQMSKCDPRLIDDIGLTTRQVEAEIAKPFWQR